MVMNTKEVMTQEAFGKMVGISQQAVSNLVSRGVLMPGASTDVWIIGYCSHLREVAAGRVATEGLDLATERARLARENADKLRMQNDVTRRSLAPTHLLEEILAKAGNKAAAILDTIPSAIQCRVPALSADDIAAIAREVAKARNMAASLTLSAFDDEASADVCSDTAAVDMRGGAQSVGGRPDETD
jgi:terminase small subunit / prophage DNA-packing protein